MPRNVNLLSSIVTGQGEPHVSTLPQALNIIHHSLKFQTLLIAKALQHHTTPVQCEHKGMALHYFSLVFLGLSSTVGFR